MSDAETTKTVTGWYTDPYGRHEARWLSQGDPTALVSDGGVESHDEPPAEPPSHVPVRIEYEVVGAEDSNDLRRADDAERGDAYDPHKATRAAENFFDQAAGSD